MFSLRNKLLVGYGILVVMLVTVSAIAVASSKQFETTYERTFDQRFAAMLECFEIERLLLDTDARVLRYLNGEETALPNIQPIVRRSELPFATLASGGERSVDQTALRRLKKAFEEWSAAYARLSDAPLAKQEEYSVLLHRSTEALLRELATFGKTSLTDMQQEAVELQSRTATARTVTIVLSAAGVLIAGLLLVGLGRWIIRPLLELTAYACEIKRGNLDIQVSFDHKDEMGQLGVAFGEMASKLKEFRKSDEAKLVRTQQSTQAAINALPHAVALFSPDRQVEISNEIAQRMFGLMPGARAEQFPHKWLEPLLREALASREPVEPLGYENVIQVFEQGREMFFLPHAQPAIDEAGQVTGVTVVLVDATQLRQIDEAKSGLISTVSHELKTPLTSVQMSIHLLLEDAAPLLRPKQLELLEAAKDDANRLQRLIDELLDLGRLRAGRATMAIETLTCDALVEQAMTSMRREFAAKQITVTVDVPATLPPVRADASRMEQVLGNLLSNACKYTPVGGSVHVAARGVERFVRFSIADTGVGIDAADRAKVFDRYFRGAQTAGTQGAGLGLAIAREIVEAHGGTIGVDAKVPNGSIFHFTLLRADVALTPD